MGFLLRHFFIPKILFSISLVRFFDSRLRSPVSSTRGSRRVILLGVLDLILKVVVFGVGDRGCLVFAHDREWVRLRNMVLLIVSAR